MLYIKKFTNQGNSLHPYFCIVKCGLGRHPSFPPGLVSAQPLAASRLSLDPGSQWHMGGHSSSYVLCCAFPCGFRNEEEVVNKSKRSSCKLSGAHPGPGTANILQVFLMYILQMGTPRLSLNPGLKVDCTAAEWAAETDFRPLSPWPLPFTGVPSGPALLPAMLLPRLPAGELGSGLRQCLHTAWEKPKCHFHLIINMCQRGLDPSDLGLWGHWTVKSL